MAQLALAVCVVFLQELGVLWDHEYCYEYNAATDDETFFAYCEHGCCGMIYSRQCCESDEDWTGVIIGCVTGGLIFIALVVTCIVLVVCINKKNIGNRGRVIAPLQQGTTHVHRTTNAQGTTHVHRTTNVQGTTNVSYVSTHMNWTTNAYPTQTQTMGYPMGNTQYTNPTGAFPQPPAYQEHTTPSTAPPAYPSESELYQNHLPPLGGAGTSTQPNAPVFPPISNNGLETSKV
ncbi:uncharacterized protein [Argopecten irradians]|uniref:uncharacterized protein n=1 Tax=Argopecten irradians TaxID=31199 RepID=UPI0037216738